MPGDTRWRSWLRNCATSRKVTGSNPDGVITIFFIEIIPGVDSASHRNEYQGYLRGIKTSGA